MTWIVGLGEGIEVGDSQLSARGEYIQKVTGSVVSEWSLIMVGNVRVQCCVSQDNIRGVFITAHMDAVLNLCQMRQVYSHNLIAVNTCMWDKNSDNGLLLRMHRYNRDAELWFAKQIVTFESDMIFHMTNTIETVGTFGFQTSKSERELYIHRRKGFMEALELSFNRVSPLILP
jgi:hypothetical protein